MHHIDTLDDLKAQIVYYKSFNDGIVVYMYSLEIMTTFIFSE